MDSLYNLKRKMDEEYKKRGLSGRYEELSEKYSELKKYKETKIKINVAKF